MSTRYQWRSYGERVVDTQPAREEEVEIVDIANGLEEDNEKLRARVALLEKAIRLYERDVMPGYSLTVFRAGENYKFPREKVRDWDEVRDLIAEILATKP